MRLFFVILILSCIVSMPVNAQRREGRMAPNTSGFSLRNIAQDFHKQAITTSFADADTNWVMPITFGDSLINQNITDQSRNILGAYLLCPGFYQMVCRSYCIRAGTYGPSQGDSYLYAALKGPKENLIKNLLTAAEKKGNVSQQDLQLIFWAIIAKTKFSDLNPRLQALSMMLLTPAQLLDFNGGALGFVPKIVVQRAIVALPVHVQQIIIAENELRQMFSNANATYQQYEQLAVKAGMAPVDRPAFKRGRWCKHPDGYYIRYLPESYNKTTVQVFVPLHPKTAPDEVLDLTVNNDPENCSFQVEFNAIGSVAVPSNTGSQRLLQSNELFTSNN